MTTVSKAKKKQSLLIRFISIPFRTLLKARNFYMKGLEDCAGRVGGGGVGGYATSQVHLPRSFSVNSSGSTVNEDMREFIRTASSKKNNAGKENKNDNIIRAPAGSSDINRSVRPIAGVRQAENTTSNGRGMRSYSVGLKMVRIDEERVSTFDEDEVDVRADVFTRSRSYAVNKRYAGFV